MENKELQTTSTSPATISAETLIAQAIDKGVPVETLERLLAMRTQLKAEFAKEAYDKAMAEFQADCPIIEKTKAVYDRDKVTIRYKYAPLESIVEQVKSFIGKHGFSYSLDAIQDDQFIGVVCRVKHDLGHAAESSFKVPIGSENYMSDVQKYGARITFAKRYAFCNAFGIMTGDEDTDAVEEPKPFKTPNSVPKSVQAGTPTPTTKTSPAKPQQATESSKLGAEILNDQKIKIKALCDQLDATLDFAMEKGDAYKTFVKEKTGYNLETGYYLMIIKSLEKLIAVEQQKQGDETEKTLKEFDAKEKNAKYDDKGKLLNSVH